ncbi:MAG: hypothetical protein GWN18_11550, partial [Thermoplasmata archaeon]|nr:hypothetical protein [Thermoplasmata archaeon]NIT77976.1 hypothetical protein [Thermoplasmata archaeon]NIU49674.1 hypothetical protein [Thermoplasmata archaeon]NIV79347.1 hypothetical protein [Thermoplasmata archaeon]NIW83175.1 hypothetical protein [Thermoplasmata archaeon]
FAVRSVDAPSQVDLGNSATVTVSVGNTGDGSGTATVQVSANGSLVGGRSVTLSPGQSRDVGFTWTPGA